MYREIVADLESWKESEDRKPLLIIGAKSVGKTWAVRDFGDAFFNVTVIIDFKTQPDMLDLFGSGISKRKIHKMLTQYLDSKINPANMLIVLENIHFLKNPLESFKFFYTEMKEYFICTTTSHSPSLIFGDEDYSNYIFETHILPLSFGEFLIINKAGALASAIEDNKNNPLNDRQIALIGEYLKIFYIVGGMPESVKCWIETGDFDAVNEIKTKIINQYLKDFENIKSKPLRKKVLEIWNSIPAQLNRETKKFHYDIVKLTARKREYEGSLNWLVDRGYLSRLNKVDNNSSYEIFMTDVGMLSSLYNTSHEDLKENISSLLCNNSALTEQFVFQELLYNKTINDIYYWNSKATARIEFLFIDSGFMVPIDINIDGNKKSQSLRVFKEQNPTPMSVRITYENFSVDSGILNIPIYSIWNL